MHPQPRPLNLALSVVPVPELGAHLSLCLGHLYTAWAAKLILAKKKPSKTELGYFAVRGHRGAEEFVLTLVRGTSLAEVTEHRIAIMDNPRESTIDGRNYGPFCSVDEVIWVLGQVVMPFNLATGEPWYVAGRRHTCMTHQ